MVPYTVRGQSSVIVVCLSYCYLSLLIVPYTVRGQSSVIVVCLSYCYLSLLIVANTAMLIISHYSWKYPCYIWNICWRMMYHKPFPNHAPCLLDCIFMKQKFFCYWLTITKLWNLCTPLSTVPIPIVIAMLMFNAKTHLPYYSLQSQQKIDFNVVDSHP